LRGDKIVINEISATVLSVENGNTVQLSNGLTVKLIGIQNTPGAQGYLQSFLQSKSVTLRVNEGDEQTIDTYDTEVYAYVNTYSIAVNGEMLRKGFAKLDSYYLTDSAGVFKSYVQGRSGEKRELSFEELFTKYAPATFSIKTNDGLGTGFFINAEGLAVSNAHVLNSQDDLSGVRIYLWDSDGEVAAHRYRTVQRIVMERYDGDLGKDDWVVFYVRRDEEHEKFAYYDLSKERARQGQLIAVLGTPEGKNGNFTEGSISNIEDNLITISADINAGNSGGPVVNKSGNVIGIASWVKAEGYSKLNCAFNIQPIRNALDNMGDIYYGGK
jgi:S1-C subfamily serine protease